MSVFSEYLFEMNPGIINLPVLANYRADRVVNSTLELFIKIRSHAFKFIEKTLDSRNYGNYRESNNLFCYERATFISRLFHSNLKLDTNLHRNLIQKQFFKYPIY